MSGSGGDSGYDFQAESCAFVAAHVVAERPLEVFVDTRDIPVAISMETGGPGDDSCVELITGDRIEIQAKHAMQKGNDFWDAILRLVRGLIADARLYCVLLTDSEASRTIRSELKSDIERLAGGRSDGLNPISVEVLERLTELDGFTHEVFRRLRIVVVDLEPTRDGRRLAISLLANCLQSPDDAGLAWSKLVEGGHDLIRHRGRRDAETILQLLERDLRLSSRDTAAITVVGRFRRWVAVANSQFFVPGLGVSLPIDEAWTKLRTIDDAKQRPADRKTFEQQIKNYHEWHRLADHSTASDTHAEYVVEFTPRSLILGRPGSGKSTLAKRNAFRLSVAGKIVFKVRLKLVANLFLQGMSLDDALWTVAADGFGVPLNDVRRFLAAPDYLIADGLDECDPHRLTIAQGLVAWSHGHPSCHICILTRPVGHDPGLAPGYAHFELLPLDANSVGEHSLRLCEAFHRDKVTAVTTWVRFGKATNKDNHQSNVASIASRNPLLLGFIVRLCADGVDLGKNRAALYQQIVDVVRTSPVNDRDSSPQLPAILVGRIAEHLAWNGITQPTQLAEKTIEEVAQGLSETLQLSLFEAIEQTEAGVRFWEDRRLIERLSAGHLQALAIIHPSLGEFCAAARVARFDDEKFMQWICSAARHPEWRQVILLAAGATEFDRVVKGLLKFDQPDDPCSTEATLAAECLLEQESDSELTSVVSKSLATRLESPIPLVSIEAACGLLGLVPHASELIGGIAATLLDHEFEWTRLGAFALAVAAGRPETTIERVRNWLERFQRVESYFIPGTFPPVQDRLPREASKLQDFLLPRVIRRIYEGLPKEDARSIVSRFASDEHISMHHFQIANEALKELGDEELREILSKRWRASDEDFARRLTGSIKRSRKGELRFVKAIEEAALKSGGVTDKTVVYKEFPLMGVIFAALKVWESTAGAIYDSANEEALPVLVEVLRATIAVMKISPTELAAEANSAISQLTNAPEYGLYQYVPQISCDPKWDRAAECNRDIEKIGQALLHPGDPVVRVAAILLYEGVAGDAAGRLLEHALHGGHETSLRYIAMLSEKVWGEAAIEKILARLQQQITPGCEHLFSALANAISASNREQVLPTLKQGLVSSDPKIATPIAEALAKESSSSRNVGAAEIRSVYEHWTVRGTICDEHNTVVFGDRCPECIVIPPSPRAALVKCLAALEALSPEEQFALTGDPRHDVRKVANELLVQRAESDSGFFRELLSKLDAVPNSSDLCRELFALPKNVLERERPLLLRLFETGSLETRVIVVHSLESGWLPTGDAVALVQSLTNDETPSMRNAASRVLRVLRANENHDQ